MATGKTSIAKGCGYIAAQLFGCVFATMFLGLVFNSSYGSLRDMAQALVPTVPTGVRNIDAVFSEFFTTYIFIFVIFSVVYVLLFR